MENVITLMVFGIKKGERQKDNSEIERGGSSV